ncbi:MAG: ABC transporter permease subunit [Tenericutes bacterium]|nr:ABC transporter permease subunit [Mycoplasmatota bacterium]
MKKNGITVLSIFFLFLVWQVSAMSVNSALLLPGPKEVLSAFGKIFIESDSLTVILFTVLRLLLGLLFATVPGILLGIVAGFNKNFASFMTPIVTVLRTIPVIALTVILLIMAGSKLTPYYITFFMLFPLIYQAVYGAITNIDKELIDVYKLEDNHFLSGLIHCYLPLISSNIRTALLQSLGLGLKVMIMAEFLAQTDNSIGKAISFAKANLAYDEIFAWTLLLIIIAVLFELLINHYQPITDKIKRISK